MQVISSFEQLAAKFVEARQQRDISDDAFRQSLGGWHLDPAVIGDIPTDPHSDAFHAFQLKLYERLTKQQYDVANEGTDFDFDRELRQPYPYGTESAETVGAHLIGYGWLIKSMGLSPKARVLEVGSGYGALTYHLAAMGYRVTCLDISAPLLEFVQARTAQSPEPVETICGDMASAELPTTYDAIIFNASLHHSFEHRQVIQRYKNALNPDGILVFVAEPIFGTKSPVVPYSWGLRLDGMSIWSICEWGWLELGFQEPYFLEIIKAAGLHLSRHNLGISGQTDVWIARRVTDGVEQRSYQMDLESAVIVRLRSVVGRLRNSVVGRLVQRMTK